MKNQNTRNRLGNLIHLPRLHKGCLLALALAPVCALSAAPGQGPGANQGKKERPSPTEVVERFDTDGDGLISQGEATGRLGQNFARIDADGDGLISADDIVATREGVRERVEQARDKLRQADRNNNRAISLDEAEAAGLERIVGRFDQLDLNGDGEITREEMRAARANNRPGKRGAI
jgi:Ca2+-binding EF-hand superfamily protein